jgi:hypothetical protein
VIGRCGSRYFLRFYPRASPYLAILARRRRDAEERSSIFEPFRLPVEFFQRFRPADHPQPCEGCVLLSFARAAPVPAAVLGVANVERACLARLLRMRGKISARGVNLDCALVLSVCGGRHEHIVSRPRAGCRLISARWWERAGVM